MPRLSKPFAAHRTLQVYLEYMLKQREGQAAPNRLSLSLYELFYRAFFISRLLAGSS